MAALVLPPPVRQDPAPKPKINVRNHLKKPGWDAPQGNLLQLYLDACEALQVSANTGVAAELIRRARVIQPLPYHRIAGKAPVEYIDAVFQHLSPCDDGLVVLSTLAKAMETLNPRMVEEDLTSQLPWLQSAAQTKVGRQEFDQAVLVYTEGLSHAELEQGILEVLAFPPDVDLQLLGRRGLLAAAFRRMDCDASGLIPMEEAVLLLVHLAPGKNLDKAALSLQLLTRPHYAQVNETDFLEVAEALTADLTDRQVERAVLDILTQRIRPPHRYDFTRTCLGPKGLQPLLEALAHDPSYVALDLSRCGIHNEGCEALAQALASHPCLSELGVSGNPISDQGGLALASLLQQNPRIYRVNISRTHLLRNWSRTHHDAEGPSPCENGGPLVRALHRNRASRRRSPQQVVQLLARHAADLKALMFSMADERGRVVLSELQDALVEMGHDWDFDEETLNAVVHSEKLLGTCGEVRDSSRMLMVTYAEFMQFLRSEDPLQAVCHSIRHHRQEVKHAFYQRAGEKGADAAAVPGGKGTPGDDVANGEASVAGPTLSLQEIKSVLKELAERPGSGWNVMLEDIEQQLVPQLFGKEGKGAAATGDCLLLWSQFFNTVLCLYNR